MSIQHIALHAVVHLRRHSRTAQSAMLSVLLCFFISGAGLGAISAHADNGRTSQFRREEIRNYKNDAGTAAAKAQAQHGGKVLNVSKSTSNGRTVYRVKLLLDSGRIKIVTIPE